MAITTKSHLPLVSATKFNVAPQAIDDGAGAYGTAVNAGTGDWVLGSDLPKGRKLLVIVETAGLTSTPTALKVALFGSATDANGTSGAEISSTVTEWATPAGDTVYTTEIDLAAVSDLTKYYSLGLTSNGGGSTSILAGATALVLDPTHGS
jgi:hypothetical protein